MPLFRFAVLRIGLFLFLLLSSIAILYTTTQSAATVRQLSLQALESTALALASTVEGELRSGDGLTAPHVQNILSDRVVAYALVADPNGDIRFHTNPALINARLPEKDRGETLRSGKISSRRTILRTGLPVLEFDYPLHLRDGKVQLLRLVLHTYPADRIMAHSGGMWWTVGMVLLVLWATGILVDRMFFRQIRLQQQLQKSEQWALIGQMTSVLAHEIRNSLGGIKGYAQWVDEKTEVGDPRKTGLAMIVKGTDRIDALVRELLDFSREESYHPEPLPVEPIVQEAVASASFPDDVRLRTEIEPGLLVLADREKIHRVLLNGIRNAIEAMEEDRERGLSIRAAVKGKWIEIRLEDTGPGLSEETTRKLFTPFFTTKTTGTGLGLAYSKKLVEGMGGAISLAERSGGRGAVLTIRLPKATGVGYGTGDSDR